MSDRTYPLFSVFCFLGFILPLIPLPWHVQALNSGTSFFIFWSSLACLNQFVNSIVWAGNALNPAPWWCEISIRIMMGASVGIPASSLCINRRLYYITNVRASSISFAERRRALLVDSLICLLFPSIFIALQYIVQGHRYNIVEDIGCYPALYDTLPTFFISSMWPVIIGLISAVYCVLSLRSFARRRVEFSQFLSSNTTLTVGRYFRLMALSMTEICATTPLAIFIICLNATATPVSPWISWADTHYNFSRVEQIPAVFWRNNHLVAVAIEVSRWVNPTCSFIFFAFFGFAQESQKHYKLAWHWLRDRLPSLKSDLSGTIKHAKSPYQLDTSSKPFGSTDSTSIFPLRDFKTSDYAQSADPPVAVKKSYGLDSYLSSAESPTFIRDEALDRVKLAVTLSTSQKSGLYRSRTL